MKRFLWLPVFLAAMVITTAALAVTWVPGAVPDWNQPYAYVPPGGDPNPGVNTDPYDCWCSPTAAANLFGWWEDNPGVTGLNLTGLTDRQAFPLSPAYANNAVAPFWQQGLWHDGTVEIGWHMDTNQWASNPGPGGWANKGTGTQFGAIGLGAVAYAGAAWNDATTGLAKVSHPFSTRLYGWGAGVTAATVWADYIADIDGSIPLLVTFDCWVMVATEQDIGDNVYKYDFSGSGMAHTVTGVGYIDPTPGVMDGGELFVVHDNWSTTKTNVAVPLWTFWTGDPATSTAAPWIQNDHFAWIPEPSVLLLVGASVLLLLKKRKTG